MDTAPPIGFLVFGIIAAPADDESGILDAISAKNPIAVLVLGLAAIPAVIAMIKWLFNFQQKFTNFYIQENDKLRERVDNMEAEILEKDNTILQLKSQVGEQALRIRELEMHGERQDRVIERLERKLDERRS